MYSNIPFLDNKETFGINFDSVEIGFTNFDHPTSKKQETESEPEWKLRRKYNLKRGSKISSQVRQKDAMYNQLHDWWMDKNLSPKKEEAICHLRKNISQCCHHSLFREHNGGTKEFIGAHTCKHKMCPVCNAQRSKKTRKVWRSFFERNPELMKQYDFMHLTLTVPHTQKGWRGKQWYAEELMKEFNYIRKKATWKKHVYGGEFGIEATRGNNGFHIHIHALLLVKKSKQNRNYLHQFILEAWNRQTKGSSSRSTFTPEEQEAILKSNKLLTKEKVNQLFPCGATLIGLDGLYIQNGSSRRYITPKDSQDTFLAGIMECIKYHFEPIALKEDGTYDFDLIADILPEIKGKSLYRRFGAFHSRSKNAHHDVKSLSLNFKEEDAITNIAEEVEEFGREEITHPETGEVVAREDYRYFLVNLSKVLFDPEDDFKIKISPGVKIRYLSAVTVIDALVDMELIAMHSQINKHNLITTKTKYYA